MIPSVGKMFGGVSLNVLTAPVPDHSAAEPPGWALVVTPGLLVSRKVGYK